MAEYGDSIEVRVNSLLVKWPLNKFLFMFSYLSQDYDLYEQIGKGGFASVYRGVCKINGMVVAVKMVTFCA